jgi:hypothetical protein
VEEQLKTMKMERLISREDAMSQLSNPRLSKTG